jgi:hypothetical protein
VPVAKHGLPVKTLVLAVERRQTSYPTTTTATPELVACVLGLKKRLSLAACATALGVRRSELRLVAPAQLVQLCGFPRGAIGPVGSAWATPPSATLLDDTLCCENENRCKESEPEPELVLGASEVGLRAQHAEAPLSVLLCGAGKQGLVVQLLVSTLVEKLGALPYNISEAREVQRDDI